MRPLITLLVALTLGLSGGWFGSSAAGPAHAPAVTPVHMRLDPGTFARLAEAVKPAVVNVNTERRGPRRSSAEEFDGRGLGSGVIIDASGLALTNAHVVDGASQVEATLLDGTRHRATVLGLDTRTDVAVLRLEADGKTFPFLSLGDSDGVRVGDWVVAVGSPFGLQATVTSGIVSARARQIGAGPYDDFLQTDAAINPGNSGGPLVNMRGEVIGINTAIVRGGSGIGLAIPANVARRVSTHLVEHATVTRGWLGVLLQPLTHLLGQAPGERQRSHLGFDVRPLTSGRARELNRRSREGVVVGSVEDDSAAAEAGIRPGDVIVEANRQPVKSLADFQRAIRDMKKGDRLTVRLERGENALYVVVVPERG